MKHWTEASTADFHYRVAFDFIEDLRSRMEELGLSQAALAKRLGISEGRVSQIFSNPGNLTIEKMIAYARALELKVTVVAYDDGDKDNKQGPIPSEIFRICWDRSGKPASMWDLENDAEFESDLHLPPPVVVSCDLPEKPLRYQKKGKSEGEEKGNVFPFAA